MNSTDTTTLQFVFLGSNSFEGYLQRDHTFARLLSQRKYDVRYIERMPSFGAWFRNVFYQSIFSKGLEKNDFSCTNDFLHIYKPPMVPTFSMNTWTPLWDQWLFRNWFKKWRHSIVRNKSIIIITTPYWWNGFLTKSDFPGSLIIYDKSDDILVGAHTSSTIRRMKYAEERLLQDADHVIFSAYTMAERNSSQQTTVIPNAVTDWMVREAEKTDTISQGIKKICFLGAFDDRWIDIDLLKESALSYPAYEFIFIGRVTRAIERCFRQVKNISLLGSKTGKELLSLLHSMDVFLIPFRENTITTVVNPLKLYEYCAFGIPIVCTATKELERYRDLLYISKTAKEFIENISIAIQENDTIMRKRRRQFAKENTWTVRVNMLLDLIDSLEKPYCSKNVINEEGIA